MFLSDFFHCIQAVWFISIKSLVVFSSSAFSVAEDLWRVPSHRWCDSLIALIASVSPFGQSLWPLSRRCCVLRHWFLFSFPLLLWVWLVLGGNLPTFRACVKKEETCKVHTLGSQLKKLRCVSYLLLCNKLLQSKAAGKVGK